MSKYDKEREKLGIRTVGEQSSSIDQNSKYAKEREALFNPTPVLEPPPPIEYPSSLDFRKSPVVQKLEAFKEKEIEDIPVSIRQSRVVQAAEKAAPEIARKESERIAEEARWAEKPLLVRGQKKLYDATLGPVTDAAMRVAANVVDPFQLTRGVAAREGAMLRNNPITAPFSAPESTSEKVTDIVGQVAGSLAPGAGAFKVVGKPLGKLAIRGLESLSPAAREAVEAIARNRGVDAATLINTLARGAGTGAGFGVMREGLQAATGDDQSLGGRLEDIALDTALGGAGDVALGGVLARLGRRPNQQQTAQQTVPTAPKLDPLRPKLQDEFTPGQSLAPESASDIVPFTPEKKGFARLAGLDLG